LFKVLFVCSGNKGISPVVKAQADSLTKNGVNIVFYLIKGNGLIGYFRNIKLLKKYLEENKFDIIHAHYGISAIVATFARAKPIIASLMGSDVMAGSWQIYIIKLFARSVWAATIVKSSEMANIIGKNYVQIFPNGVDIKHFYPMNIKQAKKLIGLKPEKQYLLFAGDPERREKHFALMQKAFNLLNEDNLELVCLQNIPHSEVSNYINSAEVCVLTSLWEGSPNVIKEAMACNTPIVTTNVGDVKWVIGDTSGCYISSYDTEEMVEKIKLALNLTSRTNGRKRIIELGLDSRSMAKRIIDLYEQTLTKKSIRTNLLNDKG